MRKREAGSGAQGGFTLIELMLALFISVFVVGGYVGANCIIQKNSEEAFERSVATQDAQRIIELMRNTAQTGTFPNNVTTDYNGAIADPQFSNLTNEQIAVTYADTTANPLDATVTTTWTSNTGRALATALRTLITKR